jgi:hypothetical protein
MARLIERVTRNFGEKRLTGSIFLDVAKAFFTHALSPGSVFNFIYN